MRPGVHKYTVLIEYDSRGKRVTKLFHDPWKAKSFYVMKDKQGKKPKIVEVT